MTHIHMVPLWGWRNHQLVWQRVATFGVPLACVAAAQSFFAWINPGEEEFRWNINMTGGRQQGR